MCVKEVVVGIFSRSDHMVYQWLRQFLEKKVGYVHRVLLIGDNWDFRQEVKNCTFAILHHRKTPGSSAVSDFMYDAELKFLHDTLGKSNVIVVIDGMEESDDRERYRVLAKLLSVRRLAGDLFLFGPRDRNTNSNEDEENVSLIIQTTLEEKLENMLRIIKVHSATAFCRYYGKLAAPLLMIAIFLSVSLALYFKVIKPHLKH